MAFVMFDNRYFRTPEFITFQQETTFPVFTQILSSVVRESKLSRDPNYGGFFIYNEFFRYGKLVGRYRQEDIAKNLGFSPKSQGNISKRIKKLEDMGLIKVIYVNGRKGRLCYYQVGVWQGEWGTAKGPNKYTETLWYDTIFSAYAKVAEEKRELKRDIDQLPGLIRMMEISKETSEPWLWARNEIIRINGGLQGVYVEGT